MSEPFHSYDIRGIYPKTINEEIVFKIGKALAKKYNLKKVVIGYDYRLSSPALFKSLSEGLLAMGCNVTSLGYTATPILYHITITEKFDLGIMITASHNPKEYNGIKVCTNEGLAISYNNGLNEIEKMIHTEIPEKEIKGNLKEINVLKKYSDYIKSHLKPLTKKFRIAVDTGNGVAGPIVEKILEDEINVGNLELTKLYFEPDGSYPNHAANPLIPENLIDIINKIKNENLDIGFAFDGDGDRCIIIDNKGEIINTDLLLCLIAEKETPKHPNQTYYYDLRFSKVVKEYIESLGNKAVISKVGHVTYKEKMKKEGGLVAAELSGHVMFKENLNMDDGFFLMVKILNYLSESEKPISEMIKPFKKYYQSKEINNKVKDKDLVLEEIKNKYKNGKITELDGVTVEYPDFWFNIRKSNTEPLLRLRIEANSQKLLDSKIKELTQFIETFK